MRKRRWTYTLRDIAEITGRSIHTVRDDHASGAFDSDVFASAVEYMLRNGLDVKMKGEQKWVN